jgi:hypothetical protein
VARLRAGTRSHLLCSSFVVETTLTRLPVSDPRCQPSRISLRWITYELHAQKFNIENKRARRREETGKRHDQPARLIEGQHVMGWCEALNELDTAYPGRIKYHDSRQPIKINLHT